MNYSGATGCISVLFWVLATALQAQNIAVFTSVEPTGQTEGLILPATHTFQLLAQTGDSIANDATLRTAPDFTAYVPKYGRNDLGYLSLNHEIGNLQGGATVFDLQFDKIKHLWTITNGQPVDFSLENGVSKPCSGGITPWGTVICGEEAVQTSDLDANRYHDAGWLVEFDPKSREIIQKIWRAGNALHENCAISSDQKRMYWGADDATRGFIFKYVAQVKKQLAQGNLYVLVRDDSTASTGTWLEVPNETADQCNNINAFCLANGAWNFAGVEDIEIGPYEKLYFAAKYSGRIWRFRDNGPTVSALEVFVENTTYPVTTTGGVQWVSWGTGADNLAFDNANNLWVLQDGGSYNIWMVKPTHTAANPKVSLFATTPAGSEPTGITFTPDKRFMFLSFQHPSPANSDITLDITGKPVVFNRGTTVVIARKEFLGAPSPRPPDPVDPENRERAFEVTVSPNPAKTGILTLHAAAFQDNKPVSLAIFDPSGKLCFADDVVSFQQKVFLNFTPVQRGVYRIQVRLDGEVRVTTVIME